LAEPVPEHNNLIFVGDPMCSWCWGIAPALEELRRYCAKQNLAFVIVVGGLRPGGGTPWNDNFKDFLRHHWGEVEKRSGQTFGTALLDKEYFDYDTEPACRAVVVARAMLHATDPDGARLLGFFTAIQKKFYVDSQDPTELAFYADICGAAGLDFAQFSAGFESEQFRGETGGDFELSRGWGVRGFPTVIVQQGTSGQMIATGLATAEQMIERIEHSREHARQG
jgi:putative protein-disulfide isomerase